MNLNTWKFPSKFTYLKIYTFFNTLLRHMACKYQLLIWNIKYLWRTQGLLYRIKVFPKIIITNYVFSVIMIAFLFPEHESLNLSVFIISCEYINLFFSAMKIKPCQLVLIPSHKSHVCQTAQGLEGASCSTNNTWKKVSGMR